jgi:glycosyltransferase involved in cell wall biosynthesis
LKAYEQTPDELLVAQGRRVYFGKPTNQTTLPRVAGPKGNGGFVLPCSVDFERFRPGPKNTTLLDRYALAGKIVVLTLGRLSDSESYKGIDEVLELLPELTEEIVDVVYLVVGDGSDRRRLEEKAKSLGLNKHVGFTGYVPQKRKGRPLPACGRLRNAESGGWVWVSFLRGDGLRYPSSCPQSQWQSRSGEQWGARYSGRSERPTRHQGGCS